LKRRGVRVALAATLIAVPVVAFAAPLTVPNTFSSGNVISSSEMNGNFDAVKTAIDDNDARIGAIEAAVAPHACEWSVQQGSNVTLVQANCPANKHVIAGGCRKNSSGGTLNSSLAGVNGNYPLNGDAATTVDAWLCVWDTPGTHWAQALCCAF
jgi:hypothetical protein